MELLGWFSERNKQEQKTNTSEEASANTKHLYVCAGRLEGRVVCVFKDGFLEWFGWAGFKHFGIIWILEYFNI